MARTYIGRSNAAPVRQMPMLFVRAPGPAIAGSLICTPWKRGEVLSDAQRETVLAIRARIVTALGLPPVSWVEADRFTAIPKPDPDWLKRWANDHPVVRIAPPG
jgi:hypothetical protein